MDEEKNNSKKRGNLSVVILIALVIFLSIEAVVLVNLKKRKEKRQEAPAIVTEEQVQEEEPEEEADERITSYAALKAKEVYALLGTLDRGEEVELIESCPEDDDYYIVLTKYGYGMVEKRFISVQEYEAWSGIAVKGTALYSDADMLEYVRNAGRNESLEVIDDFGDCYLVKTADEYFFVPKNGVSKASENEMNSYSGGNTGGGNSGSGNSGGGEVIIGGGGGGNSGTGGSSEGGSTGGNSGGSTGNDGGDISLSFAGKPELVSLAYYVPQSGSTNGTAKIRADGTEVFSALLSRGDTVGVMSVENGLCTVIINGTEAYIRSELLRFEGEAEYTQWQGYVGKSSFYSDERLLKKADINVQPNTELTVVDEIENCLLISLGGELYYTEKDNVNTEPVLSDNASAADSGNNGGGSGNIGGDSGNGGVIIGGGGGDSGGGGSAGGGGSEGGSTGGGGTSGGEASTPDWSEPVL